MVVLLGSLPSSNSGSEREKRITNEPRSKQNSARTLHVCLCRRVGAAFIYSVWTAFHDERYAANFQWECTLDVANFQLRLWHAAPFAMYFSPIQLILITIVFSGQPDFLCTIWFAYALGKRYKIFAGLVFLFALN